MRRRSGNGSSAAAPDAAPIDGLCVVFDVAIQSLYVLADDVKGTCHDDRDAWSLIASVCPLLCRSLRSSCVLDASAAATLAYERARMLSRRGEGDRSGIGATSSLFPSTRWYYCGVPRAIDLERAGRAVRRSETDVEAPRVPADATEDGAYRFDDPPRRDCNGEQGGAEVPFVVSALPFRWRSGTDVRRCRLVAASRIDRALRADGAIREGWHRCSDLPLVHPKVSTYVVWCRSLVRAIEAGHRVGRADDGSPLVQMRTCCAGDCTRRIPAHSHRISSRSVREGTIQAALEFAPILDGCDLRETRYWRQLVDLAGLVVGTGGTPSSSRRCRWTGERSGDGRDHPLESHHLFCSASCMRSYCSAVWRAIPFDLAAMTRRQRNGANGHYGTQEVAIGSHVHTELRFVWERNARLSRAIGRDDWQTTEWWRTLAPSTRIRDVCIHLTRRLVLALNIDSALVASSAIVEGLRRGADARRMLPGGSRRWRADTVAPGTGLLEPALSKLMWDLACSHECSPEASPAVSNDGRFMKSVRAHAVARFDALDRARAQA